LYVWRSGRVYVIHVRASIPASVHT